MKNRHHLFEAVLDGGTERIFKDFAVVCDLTVDGIVVRIHVNVLKCVGIGMDTIIFGAIPGKFTVQSQIA